MYGILDVLIIVYYSLLRKKKFLKCYILSIIFTPHKALLFPLIAECKLHQCIIYYRVITLIEILTIYLFISQLVFSNHLI